MNRMCEHVALCKNFEQCLFDSCSTRKGATRDNVSNYGGTLPFRVSLEGLVATPRCIERGYRYCPKTSVMGHFEKR